MVHQNLLLGNFPKKKPLHHRDGVSSRLQSESHIWQPGTTWTRWTSAMPSKRVGFLGTIRWCLIDAIRVIEFPSQCSSSKCNFTKSSHTKSNVRSQNLKKRHCCYSKTHIISASTKPPFFLQILSTLFTHLFHSETPTKGWNNPNPHNFWAL